LHRPIPNGFAIKQATIVRKADGWYVRRVSWGRHSSRTVTCRWS
jgi:hypothetical protein